MWVLGVPGRKPVGMEERYPTAGATSPAVGYLSQGLHLRDSSCLPRGAGSQGFQRNTVMFKT